MTRARLWALALSSIAVVALAITYDFTRELATGYVVGLALVGAKAAIARRLRGEGGR